MSNALRIRQHLMVRHLHWTIERDASWEADGFWHTARSWRLVCPHCMRWWASLEIAGVPAEISGQYCDICGTPSEWHPVPGSILTALGLGRIDLPLLAALPAELVRREFNLHMAALDKGTER